MRRFLSLFACLVVLSMTFNPVVAYAGLFEFLFPSLKKPEYDPAENMVAPFAVGEGVEEKDKLEGLPVNAIPLEKPHRLSEEIGAWVMTSASEAMTFDASNVQEQFNQKEIYFDAVGRNQYVEFLRDQKILDVVQNGRFNVSSYSNQQPLLLNQGSVNGRYRWLFRVPIIMTYLDKNMTTYKNKKATLIQKASINVQVGRVEGQGKIEGLQIEQWSGSISPMEEVVDTMP